VAILASSALVVGACGGDDDSPTVAIDDPPAVAPADEPAESEPAASDTGAAGPCATAPGANVDGGYPEANLPAVQARTDALVTAFDAVDGRYCIDGGDITYFLVYDFPADGFHSLEVCGSVFINFEGDFERAGIIYTDDEVLCG